MSVFSNVSNRTREYSKQEAKFMHQRRQHKIQSQFVTTLMPHLQRYYIDYLDQELFTHRPFLFSNLPLNQCEFDYFIMQISQSNNTSNIINEHNLHMIDKSFLGESTYAIRKITLPILIRLCDTLGIPIEAILYGTLDTKKIACFNYKHYEELPPILHRYLSRRIRRTNIFSYILSDEPFCDLSVRKLGNKLGVSRTTANYLKTPNAYKHRHCSTGLPANKAQLLRYASVFDIEPELILEVPVIFFESHRHETF